MCCCLLIRNKEDCSVSREAVRVIIQGAMDTRKEFFETGLLLGDCGPGWSALSVIFPCTTLGTIHQCVSCVISLWLCTYMFVCKCVLPPGDNPIAGNKYIIYTSLQRDQGSG